jgi:hypothetical protein
MFGHQDDQQHDDNTHQEPQHDDVLEHGDAQHGDEHTPDPAPQTDSFGASSDDAQAQDDSQGATFTPAVSGGQPEPVHDDLLTTTPANDLLDIKQEALKQLSPLVGHLDQTPEEKFRTTMMMIQASDDQSLVKMAYEAAEKITDEKTKAQALLDIVNEINYFTHQSNGEA